MKIESTKLDEQIIELSKETKVNSRDGRTLENWLARWVGHAATGAGVTPNTATGQCIIHESTGELLGALAAGKLKVRFEELKPEPAEELPPPEKKEEKTEKKSWSRSKKK